MSQVVGFLSPGTMCRRDRKAPLVSVYFGGEDHPQADTDALNDALAISSVVVPVVSDIERFAAETPPCIRGINGMTMGSDQKSREALANIILENLGLMRRTRRLFISYKRYESSVAALQLRHELDSQGYDVFLDTHSVPKADDFQQVLWQRLADSDVVVLLDTPGFMTSRWTKEELAQAEAMTIGLIQVIWPGHVPASYTELCERTYLTEADLDAGNGADAAATTNCELTKAALDRIALEVEQLRARSLAARHNNLVREFCDAAELAGITATVQPERYISVALASGRTLAAIPAVGVVDASRYHEASVRFEDGRTKPDEVFLIYDHRGVRESWSKFIDWLDDFLPVKAVRVTNAAVRLGTR